MIHCKLIIALWPTSSEDEDEDNSQSHSGTPKLVWNYVFFLLVWQAVYRVSNAAVKSLLVFFRYSIFFIGKAFGCPELVEISHKSPLTFKKIRNIVNVHDNFIQYVICPRCSSVYEYGDCVKTGGKESEQCCHVAFPKHPQVSKRKQCGALLLKKVRTGKGYSLQPIKVYPYFPLQKSFERLASIAGFLEVCESWRNRKTRVPPSYLGDIYDGLIWKEFSSEVKYNFLTAPFCYLLTLNIDWFQPFSHSVYSVGAIYLTVQNLPCEHRYKEENIILVGMIPGPKEPSLSINSYLSPLVEELKIGWDKGFVVRSPQNTLLTVRVALACVACDIPATRKVCGFLGHNATLGCNKCLKKFSVTFGKGSDFSGCDRENWPLRNAELHRQQCQAFLKQTTSSSCAV